MSRKRARLGRVVATMSLWDGVETVGDFMDALAAFPRDWPVVVATPAGGGVAVEHRERAGKPIIAVFGKNGGRFGENPLTDAEYQAKSRRFLDELAAGRAYTSDYGDHRTYSPSLGPQAGCYGTHYDRRVIERMVAEGLISGDRVYLERVAYLDK